MKAYLKPSNDGGWPKLFSIPSYLIHLVPNIVPPGKNKEHFVSFIELLENNFSFFEKPNFKILHNQSHELRIYVIVKSQKWK